MPTAKKKKVEEEFQNEIEEFNKNFPKTVGRILRLVRDNKLQIKNEDGTTSDISMENINSDSKVVSKFYEIMHESDLIKRAKA